MSYHDHDVMVRAGFDPRIAMARTKRANALAGMTEEDRQAWLDQAKDSLLRIDRLHRMSRVNDAAHEMVSAVAVHYNDLTEAERDRAYMIANALQAQYIDLLSRHTKGN